MLFVYLTKGFLQFLHTARQHTLVRGAHLASRVLQVSTYAARAEVQVQQSGWPGLVLAW